MDLGKRFATWVHGEVGSAAPPAVLKHLREHDFRPFCTIEHGDVHQRDVYHPEHGFFHASGRDDSEALLNVLRQIWLVDALAEQVGPENPASAG